MGGENGNTVDNVIWCDTDAGVVIYSLRPVKASRAAREEAHTRCLRGDVTATAM